MGQARGAADAYGASGAAPPATRGRDPAAGAGFPKKSDGVLRQTGPVRYACIRQHAGMFPVVVMCRVLAGARTGYYARRQGGPGPRAPQARALLGLIRELPPD